MAIVTPRLRISTPTEPILPGRGFYQLEEDILYVQIGPFYGGRRFFSYLESELASLYFDREGRLIFIESSEARRRWEYVESLEAPRVIEPADIRWLDFRDELQASPGFKTNKNRSIVSMELIGCESVRNFYLAQHVIVQVNQADELCAIWVDDIVDDLAGQEIASFRKRLRKTGIAGSE